MPRNLQRRVSRTDLDFEQALRGEGTVMLTEGQDVNAFGADSPAPSPRFTSPKDAQTPRLVQPSTPVVVPPTPSPITGGGGASGPSSSSSGRQFTPSPSSSSRDDLFYDAEDSERQTNRRSMYRSPGTSSSPDLATLLRKAKERGGVVGVHSKKEKRHEKPPPLPGSHDRLNGTRPRSSTSSHANGSSQVTPLSKGKSRTNESYNGPSSPDWVLTSPRGRNASKDSGTVKAGKSSVRQKTSAFLGKMLGQNTVRERSKTDVGSSSAHNSPSRHSPSLYDAFAPPVPPLPDDVQATPVGSPIADVFSGLRSPDLSSKPLPPITGSLFQREDIEDRSLILVEKLDQRSESPDPVPTPELQTPSRPSNFGKRRSMSVGEAELKAAMSASATITPLPTSKEIQDGEDTHDVSLNGILSEFKGELSQLDPFSSSPLDLQDPSTPARRTALRSQTDGPVLPSLTLQAERPGFKKSASTPNSSPNPTFTLERPTGIEEPFDRPSLSSTSTSTSTSDSLQVNPIVPPRISSLQSPIRSASGPSRSTSPRAPASRHASSPLRTGYGNSFNSSLHSQTPSRDHSRLRIQHRSTASSSEPSLIPVADDARVRSPAFAATSQQDLTVSDLVLTRFSSNQSPTQGDEYVDLEARGKELASRCWAEDEDFLAKEKIAEWLGGFGRINKITLQHYINYFDFSNMRLDNAFRRLCAKLYLKAETQQVDRILEEFSRRYWECNPGSIYGSASLVHSVSYSLLLLNTDLHVAELVTRMSRNQFVRNTLAAIQTQLQPSAVAQVSSSDLSHDDSSSIRGSGSDGTETVSRSKRSNSITSWNSISRDAVLSSPGPSGNANGSTPSVHSTSVYGRNWENDMEALLKEMYNAIKSQQILQPLNSSRSSTSSLSPGIPMARNRSTRGPNDRLATLKRGSIRGIQSILGAQPGVSPYSSNSSIEGRVSPSPSFATSTHEAMYGSSSSFLAPTLGFASNLSHTIIREALEDDDRSCHSQESVSTEISITDEELALLGAPWAKEGMLCRKQYWESTGKRAKDKTWLDVFVVIQKGELSMFTFGGDTGAGGSQAVGGGNWLESAHSVGSVHLSHSLAHALPPPGYNRQRPYCMVLTLSNGAVYFFQAGTEELVNEWVSTCNYWAARTSKEPLAGGVSNMEYGWNRVTDPLPHGRSASDGASVKEDYSDGMSVRSGRSNRSKFGWREGAATVRATHSPWADRIFINDWKPPLPPTVSSVHDEESQMEALQKHVASMKNDLKQHNEYREPMTALYQPRSALALKAQGNWEKKSQYLLTEIVKYDSYIDSLQAAMSLRLKKRGEKALEKALTGANPDDNSSNLAKGKWKGPEEETIHEDEEPPLTPGAGSVFLVPSHKRETAEVGDDDDDAHDD